MATYYWVGSSGGSWDTTTTTNWATSSGGSGSAGVPGVADTVIFDTNSGASAITTGAAISVTAVTLNTGFAGTVTCGAGNSFTVSGTVTLTAGTLNTNGQICSWGYFSSSGAMARTLTLGASTISLTGATSTANWDFTTTTNLTFNCATSSITDNGGTGAFNGGGQTFYTVTFAPNSNGFIPITGANTFTTLTVSCAASTDGVTLAANQTVTGLFTATGTGGTGTNNRACLTSSSINTSQTITAASVSLTQVDFQDIHGAGAAAPFAGTSIGDMGGNSGITFTTAVTRYWVATGGGSWGATTSWSTSSGGTNGASAPLPQDTAILDANSITATGKTITFNTTRVGGTITMSALTNNPTFAHSGNVGTYIVLGGIAWPSACTISSTNAWSFQGRGSFTFMSNGLSLPQTININAPGGTYTLVGNFICTNKISLSYGTLDASTHNVNVTCTQLNLGASSTTRAVQMGSGTWTLSGTGAIWTSSPNTNLTITPGTSVIAPNDVSATTKTFSFATGDVVGAITIPANSSGAFIFDTSGTYTVGTFTFGAGTTHTFQSSKTVQFSSAPVITGSSGHLVTLNATTGGSAAIFSYGGGTVNGDYLNITDNNPAQTYAWFAGYHSSLVSNTGNWRTGSGNMQLLTATLSFTGSSGKLPQKNLTGNLRFSHGFGVATPHAPLATSDTFSIPGYLDPYIYTPGGSDPTQVTVSQGQLQITHTATTQYNECDALYYDLTNASTYVQLVDAGDTSLASHQSVFAVAFDSNNSVYITTIGANLAAYKKHSGTSTQIGSNIPYDPVAHAWWRIRESGGTTYFDTAPDSITWSNQWSVADQFVMTNVYPFVQSGCYSNNATGSHSYFDNWHFPTNAQGFPQIGGAVIDSGGVQQFEIDINRHPSLYMFYLSWGLTGGQANFPYGIMNAIVANSMIPEITWQPGDASNTVNDSTYSLANIIAGNFDTYIQQFATAAAAWRGSFYLRFAHEMNGNFYSWSEGVNGNTTGQYAQAWQHVHQVFTAICTTAIWVWCPNVEYTGSTPLPGLYPGDAYVDWLGMDGYNWGTDNSSGWQTFTQVFQQTYTDITAISNLPVMIGETACSENGGSKSAWITNMLTNELTNFPRVQVFTWFNYDKETDWRIESSTAAQSAFIAGISNYQPGVVRKTTVMPIAAIVSFSGTIGRLAALIGGRNVVLLIDGSLALRVSGKSKSYIRLLDGRSAIRVGKKLYMPL